jgi:hypothetical protein
MNHRILVYGGREYNNSVMVFSALDLLSEKLPLFIVIEGGAMGADDLAKRWALFRSRPFAEVPAHWDKLKKPAGAIRNGWMTLLQPTLGVEFIGGTGTADMRHKLEKLHVPIWRPDIEDPGPEFLGSA